MWPIFLSYIIAIDMHIKLIDNEHLTCKILVNQLKLPQKYWLPIINRFWKNFLVKFNYVKLASEST